MEGKAARAGIVLIILALFIGLFGIIVLIGVGEAANNTFIAFAAVSFSFMLLAGFLSWIEPGVRWAIAVVMAIPVNIISIVVSWSNRLLIPGAVWTVALTCVGAYMGGRLRLFRSGTQQAPPS